METKKMEPETRLDMLEKQINSIEKGMNKLVTLLDKPGEEKDRKEEQSEEDETEKKKEVGSTDVKADPEGGDVKLPKASAGETDETDKPEGEKVNFLEKQIQAGVREVLKGMGITKTTTPRTPHSQNIQKSAPMDEVMEMIQKAASGEITQADLNRNVKDFAKAEREKRIKAVLGGQ